MLYCTVLYCIVLCSCIIRACVTHPVRLNTELGARLLLTLEKKVRRSSSSSATRVPGGSMVNLVWV